MTPCNKVPSATLPPSVNDNTNVPFLSSLLSWDHTISYYIYRFYQSRGLGPIPLLALEYSGHGVPWIAGVVFLFLYPFQPYPYLSSYTYTLLCNLFTGLITDLLLVASVKLIVRRSRPHWEEKTQQFATVEQIDKYSFPSGHTTRSVYVALFIVMCYIYPLVHQRQALVSYYWCEVILTLVPCFWALCVGLSRMALGRHYMLDVLVGLGVGVVNVLIVRGLWVEEEMVMEGRRWAMTYIKG